MRLRVHFELGDVKVDEDVAGESAEAVVIAMQKRVAQELGFLKGMVVRAMAPLTFAQEVTRRYNAALNDDAPIPSSCDEFLRVGIEKNFATPLEEEKAL